MAVLDSEYATLTDLLAQQQREINDIEVTLSNQIQRIDSHDTDIGTLQDPPAGVPPPLLEWYGDGHNTREVDTLLDADLTTLTNDVATNTSDISGFSSALSTETGNRESADSGLVIVDADLQAQITANLATLTQEVIDRSNLSATVSTGLDTVNSRIDNLQTDLTTATGAGEASSDSMSSQIADLSAALQTAQTQILLLQGVGVDPEGALASQITALTIIANDAASDVAQETIDRTNADNVLQTSIVEISSSVSGLNTSILDEKNAREAADLDIQSDVSALTAEVGGHAGLIAAEESSRIAEDLILEGNVDSNTADIAVLQIGLSDEITDRSDADIAIQSQVDANTVNISSNTGDISDNTAAIAVVNAKYGVVKDGGGYITNWWINDETTAPGAFKLSNLNNNARLQAVGYEGKYFPAASVLSFSLPVTYDTEWGGAIANDFQGTDTSNYTRAVKVYATQALALDGSCFRGVDNSTGGSLFRLGQALTTFKVDFSGTVNRYLSLWYRIKNDVPDDTDRWYPVALADNTTLAARTYEPVRGQAVVQISVAADKVIEFGLTALNTLDATMDDTSNGIIYGGSVSVTAFNITTIS